MTKTTFPDGYSVITIATNKQSYVQFALNSARSILLHNDIPVYIISNLAVTVPADMQEYVSVIPADDGHAELGIGMKLYLDTYLQTAHTLFIDSDCLCFDSLSEIFDAAKDNDVSVAGTVVPAAEFCGDKHAATIKQHFGLDKLIRFNGALYYMKRSAVTTAIFNKARAIAERYDEYGFHRINNKWINEEAPLSIAMMLNTQQPIADNGRYMTDFFTDRRPAQLNVLTGQRLLKNPSPPSVLHRPWYPQSYSPVILHFGGSNINSYPYISQKALLKLHMLGAGIWLSRFVANLFIHFPYKSLHWLNGSLKRV